MKARQLRLDFSAARAHWAPNLEFAQTQNASSLMPAHVEPFLIKVMKEARGRLCAEHSDLLRDIDTLIRQETQHYVQHQRFNEALRAAGYPRLAEFERQLANDYAQFLHSRSLRFNCAYCVGFESLGPAIGYCYFEGFGGLLEGADELPVLLWKWHLAEEFEHREVCFRVYSVLFGKRFIERYVWRLVGLVTVLRHLKRWGDRVGRYMIDVDRERMNDAQRAASRRREFVCRWKMLWHLAPRILRIFLPSYHPRRDAPPSGLHAFVAHVEALYGDQETLP